MGQENSFYSIATPFGAFYGENAHQHLGVDVIARDGLSVYAPVEGTVSFCGKIPKADGKQVYALTIKTPDNALVSLSPLESLGFKKGDALALGQRIGAISAVGDPSLAQSHLHMSLRRNDRYVDPSSLISFALSTQDHASVLSESKSTNTNVAPSGTQVQGASAVLRHEKVEVSHAHTSQKTAQEKVENSEMSLSKQVAQDAAEKFPSLPVLHEQTLASQIPQAKRENTCASQTIGGKDCAPEPFISGVPQAQLAGFLFLVGLTLTLAGWGGYTLLDGKFDIARKLEQLAVRGQR